VVGTVTTWALLGAAWEIEPSIVVGCVLLLAAYLFAVRWRRAATTLWFAAGVAIMALDLVGPLDVLGDSYLFSAHMLEHLVLVLVVPPLLVIGLPADTARAIVRWPPARRVERVLRRPVWAWLIGIVTLWVWHLPALYNLTLASETVHAGEHLSFLVTATIFWWPLLSPMTGSRLGTAAALTYLVAGAVANTVLGVLLTFAPVGLYPAYLHPVDELGALTLIRSGWGLDAAADQQLGGVLMWVCGMFVFLWAMLVVLARWYRAEGTLSGVDGRMTAQRAGETVQTRGE
jgi:putative membrane protein